MSDFTRRQGFDAEHRRLLRNAGITGRELAKTRYHKGEKVTQAFLVIGSILLAILILACQPAHSCEQDPSKLSPELRKAYEQLKAAEKEIPGMKVSIRCYEKEAGNDN